MSLKQQIDADLKTAMLGGDKVLTTTLRGLKAAILNVEVAKGIREDGLPDDEIIALLSKEAKKRQESAELFDQGGNSVKAEEERQEKKVIEQYLPEQASEEDVAKAVETAIAELNAEGPQMMGQVIGKVKQQLGAGADGGLIAKIAKEKLSA